MWTGDDFYFMKLALEEAERAEKEGEVPIGAVLVVEGRLVGRGRNRPIAAQDPTAHAEIEALRASCQWMRNYRIPGATMYVTLEPCLMCFGALIHARLGRLVYGAPDPKVGVSRILPALAEARFNHTVDVQGGLLEDECRGMLQRFFRMKRGLGS